ncbi:NAD-dependent succinate-semialdehyde dehydrogenase [Streptomyces albidoflavus]|nr:NAD-dependent succinate-semialdehyde dehydrogenase [Streptomyces albidoflavus]
MAGITFPVTDPADGSLITQVADGLAQDAHAAVDAAADAFPTWAATPARQRAEILQQAVALILAERDNLTAVISWENGKPLSHADAEVTLAAEFLRRLAEEAARSHSSYDRTPQDSPHALVTSRPAGVSAVVTPWNFPAAMVARKAGAALAAGCTVVLKPAAETPLAALAVAHILHRAGLPDGVLNVVPTIRPSAVVTTWLNDHRVRRLSFTGPTGLDTDLPARAAARIVSSSTRLGTNAPFVIAADADIEAALDGAMTVAFQHAGQGRTLAARFHVHADVAEEFAARFGAAIESLLVGSAFRADRKIGPMISASAVSTTSRLVDEAVAAGARITHQAMVPAGQGTFYPPTLIQDVPTDAALLHEESLGPVAPVLTWTDEEDLLRQINDTEAGHAAYIYSHDLKWALQLAECIDADLFGINHSIASDPPAPFSGSRPEENRDNVRDFLETQCFLVDPSLTSPLHHTTAHPS